jgi:branched-chain amino acid transport system ATP-binding protein
MNAIKKPPILELKNITKRFGGLTANDNISLSVWPGEIVGIIGPNGSGKTTLFSLISGFLQPNEGTITFEGKDLVGLLPFAINAKGVSRTFQVVQPFAGLTVLENAMIGTLVKNYPIAEAKQKSFDILTFVGLSGKAHRLASELTLSEMKRLEMAKALSTEPKILLLDEIMSGLRPIEVDETVELIRSMRDSGITILFIEHLMRAVMALSERLYVLHHGEMIASGPSHEVMHTEAVVEAYFGEAKNIA